MFSIFTTIHIGMCHGIIVVVEGGREQFFAKHPVLGLGKYGHPNYYDKFYNIVGHIIQYEK